MQYVHCRNYNKREKFHYLMNSPFSMGFLILVVVRQTLILASGEKQRKTKKKNAITM